MESLTKENFWDEMEQKYPKAMKHFKEWIDTYKSEHDWEKLFNGSIEGYEYGCSIPGSDIYFKTTVPKYYELPIAMQFGIFLEYTQFVYIYFKEQKAITIPMAIQFDNRIALKVSDAIKAAFHIMEAKL